MDFSVFQLLRNEGLRRHAPLLASPLRSIESLGEFLAKPCAPLSLATHEIINGHKGGNKASSASAEKK
jgi:hypothetical protein